MWWYGKGSRAERELVNKFKQHGFIVVRAAGSGFEGPDIIAIKKGKEYAIECKAQEKSVLTIEKKQFEDLMRWQENSLMQVYVAWKKSHLGWFFIPLPAFEKKKINYGITFEKAANVAYKIEDLLFG
ncbi:MAG: Holliday junction resolvase Hjc [Candidatus Anstonellales archaeon]